jgi:hypothetical protein
VSDDILDLLYGEDRPQPKAKPTGYIINGVQHGAHCPCNDCIW